MEKLLLSVCEAAELMGIGRTKAYELVWKGEWPSVRIGRRLLVSAEELRQWVRQRSAEAKEAHAAQAGAALGWLSEVR